MSEEVKVLKEGKFNRLMEAGRVKGRRSRVTYRNVTISITEEGVSFKGTPFRSQVPVITTIDFRGILNFVIETYEGKEGSPVYRIRVNSFRFWTRDKSWFDIIDEKVKALGNLRRRESIQYRPTRYTIPSIIESIQS